MRHSQVRTRARNGYWRGYIRARSARASYLARRRACPAKRASAAAFLQKAACEQGIAAEKARRSVKRIRKQKSNMSQRMPRHLQHGKAQRRRFDLHGVL